MERQELKHATRDGLICGYRSYVEHLVGQLMRVLHLPQHCRDEFISAGYLGLVEAAERFRFDAGADFKTFAYLRIRGAVIDSIRDNSALSNSAYRYARAFQAAHGLREAPSAEVSFKQADAEEKLSKILEYAAKGSIAFRLSYHDLEREFSIKEDSKHNPEQELERRQFRAQLLRYLQKLPAKERKVIELYYFKDLTFDEIALKRLKVSKSWVSRLHERALLRLKEMCDADTSA